MALRPKFDSSLNLIPWLLRLPGCRVIAVAHAGVRRNTKVWLESLAGLGAVRAFSVLSLILVVKASVV